MLKPKPSIFDVITVGDVFVDIVMTGFPAWPQPGEEAFAQELFREVGGGASITACGLAKLGAYVGTLAMVGQDDGHWLVERLKACGVSTALIHQEANKATGTTISVSTTKDRSFFTYNGANGSLIELLEEKAVRHELSRARHVHFACPLSPQLLSDLIDLIHAANHTVSIDVGWHPGWLTDKACWQVLKKVDLFFPNEREAELMTGERAPETMLQKFAEAELDYVALKLGEAGSMALWKGQIIHCLPHTVSPIDTTGAGDSFDAGFLHGWLNNQPPLGCLRLANLCGALSTTGLGGVATFPARQRAEELLAHFK